MRLLRLGERLRARRYRRTHGLESYSPTFGAILWRRVGNDGLTKPERDAMTAHYMATLGKTPAMPIAERLAARQPRNDEKPPR